MTESRNSDSEPSVSAEGQRPEAEERRGQLTVAQQAALDDFVREMTGTVIPEIIRVVEERRKLASLSRQMPLKVGG
jgi:hypothetical protein